MSKKTGKPEDFKLEPTEKGKVPDGVILELRAAYSHAKDVAKGYADAATAAAEKHGIKPAALKKYIAALENDSTEEAKAECADLEKLLGVA